MVKEKISMSEIDKSKLDAAREKLSCSIDGSILDKYGKPIRLTEMTTAGG